MKKLMEWLKSFFPKPKKEDPVPVDDPDFLPEKPDLENE